MYAPVAGPIAVALINFKMPSLEIVPPLYKLAVRKPMVPVPLFKIASRPMPSVMFVPFTPLGSVPIASFCFSVPVSVNVFSPADPAVIVPDSITNLSRLLLDSKAALP